MSIIKEIIRFNPSYTGNTINIKIPFGSSDALSGYQQEIDNVTTFTATDIVNPMIDVEVRKFKCFSDALAKITFYFNNGSGTYLSFFYGFTSNDVSSIRNSFFILDYYDSFNIYNQNKIFTVYLTKIMTTTSSAPVYSLNPTVNNQFYTWYIPISYIESITGSTVVGYVNFKFFNAKTGKIIQFYNNDNLSLTSPEKMYFKTELNIPNKTWKFITTSYPNMNAREIESTNTLFINKTNDTFDKFDNLKQNYPTGNTFNYQDGSYFTT